MIATLREAWRTAGGRHALPPLIATVLLAVACLTGRQLARSRAPWTRA
ncbi:hypothetical protein ACWF0M_12350 [Kribbella sp. NPDC055110]